MKITLLKVLLATIFYLYTTTSILLHAQRGFNPVISPGGGFQFLSIDSEVMKLPGGLLKKDIQPLS